MGNNFGKPFDQEMQADILRRALMLVRDAEEGGVLVDYPNRWSEAFAYFGSAEDE